MNLDAQIEAILFWNGEPITLKKLAEILKTSVQDIEIGIAELEKKLEGRGLMIVRKEDEVMLGTHRDMGPMIEALIKEDLVKDLGKAGLETLSIILYRGPVARRDIDYIRGVNSQFILRNLLVRGLIEKVQNPDDARTFLYKATFELLTHLGVTSLDELPEFADIRKEIEVHQKHQEETEQSPDYHADAT
jgi:segregation and condensation protein B